MPKEARRTSNEKPVVDTVAPYPACKPSQAGKDAERTVNIQGNDSREVLRLLDNVPAAAAVSSSSSSTQSGNVPNPTTNTSSNSSKSITSFLDIVLPGEESHSVPVFDTCDELREKIRTFLASKYPVPGKTDSRGNPRPFSQTQLGKTLDVNSNTLRRFMDRSGEMVGAELGSYYPLYCFFEKLRIYNGEEKSAARIAREKDHPNGLKMKDPSHRKPVWITVRKGENPNEFLTPEEVARGVYFPGYPPARPKLNGSGS